MRCDYVYTDIDMLIFVQCDKDAAEGERFCAEDKARWETDFENAAQLQMSYERALEERKKKRGKR